MPISECLRTRILDHLAFLYGESQAALLWPQLETLLDDFSRRNPTLAVVQGSPQITERDAILITYGDQFQELDIPPLRTLYRVLAETLQGIVSGVHILPFFPYSSDDGFSIVDYAGVDPALGTWADIEQIGCHFRLMVDAVLNHLSRQSDWFQRFLNGDPEYTNWFITVEPGMDLSQVVRPRALPLLTPVETANGEELVWTTFSDDQIDLNFAHPPVLLTMINILLLYVEKGAQFIRLDAIAYLWKRIGSSCIHLEETHRTVKLLRCVLDAVAPGVVLITETNVPHEENISYFGAPRADGKGTDEAQMVYQFPLAPLVMHSLLSGDAGAISGWAAGLKTPAPQAAFFNFTASHDGIGVTPVRGLLSAAEIQALVDATLTHGGRVSYKDNPDGSQSVYELNISYFDALSNPTGGEPPEVQVARFGTSQAMMLALAGVPGIYAHSLFGSQSWHEGVDLTGRNRTINRQKFDRAVLERELADPDSLRHQVFAIYRRLLSARTSDPAFHPYGGQQVLLLDERIFSLLRISPDGQSQVLCLHNVSDQARPVHLVPTQVGLTAGTWQDLITGQMHRVDRAGYTLTLPPYAMRWLKT